MGWLKAGPWSTILAEQKEVLMSARTKLNAAVIHGAILVAALVGWVTSSWAIFLLATAVLIATAIHSGQIRMGRRR